MIRLSIAEVHAILNKLPLSRHMATLFALETGLDLKHVTTLKWAMAHSVMPKLTPLAADVLRVTPRYLNSTLVFWERSRDGVSPLLGLRADIEQAAGMSWAVLRHQYRYALDIGRDYEVFKRAALLDLGVSLGVS